MKLVVSQLMSSLDKDQFFFLRKIVKKAAKQQRNQKEYQTCRL